MGLGFHTLTNTLRVTLRLQEIATLCSTLGFGGTLTRLGIGIGKKGIQLQKAKISQEFLESLGPSLRILFTALGPTFIKLGQLLATRPDKIGITLSESLLPLFDKVQPIHYSRVRRVLIQELGKTRFRIFKQIEKKPLASASLSQTHLANLQDGRQVILKIQKPGASSTVKTDLIILDTIARLASKIYPKLFPYSLFEEFRDATLRELNYLEEAKNIDRFRKNYFSLFGKNDVVFPSYIPELTTEKVIVLEPMQGKKLLDLTPGSTIARDAASKGLTAVLEQIFDHGFFHGDPHAGNLFYLEDSGQIGFIDMGLVGSLEPQDKKKFLKIFLSILQKDRKGLARNLYELAETGTKTNYGEFEKEVGALIDSLQGKKLNEIPIEETFNQLTALARRQNLKIPQRYLLMLRTCIMMEGVAKHLDPNISLASVAVPVLTRSIMNRFSPWGIVKKLLK